MILTVRMKLGLKSILIFKKKIDISSEIFYSRKETGRSFVIALSLSSLNSWVMCYKSHTNLSPSDFK